MEGTMKSDLLGIYISVDDLLLTITIMAIIMVKSKHKKPQKRN